MKITSAIFTRGVVDDGSLPNDNRPQIALIGRSNVGKSSVINSLTGQKKLARSSSTPGRTQEANFFLLNDKFYLVDLPGYGYAKGSSDKRDEIAELIEWYLLHPEIQHYKVGLIVDAKVGMTDNDLYMLGLLEENSKDIVIIANKVDKLSKNDLRKNLDAIKEKAGPYSIIPYSAEKHIGMKELATALFPL